MPGKTRIYWLHCLTPTHVGTGRGIGYIDLPLYREKITNWPGVPGSAVKGVWADRHRANEANRQTNALLRVAFGKADDKNNGGSNAGALIPTDARIVCLPVRSFSGTFAWCTSRLALQLLRRDLALAGFNDLPPLPEIVSDGEARIYTGSALVDTASGSATDRRVFLEDLDLKARDNKPDVHRWAEKIAEWVFDNEWRETFKKRFALLPDAVFDYLTETGTEVVTRVKIQDETKTVADGQLWSEESLPAEAILAGLVTCDRVYDRNSSITEEEVLEKFVKEPLTLQVGGKASVGRGKVRCVFTA